MSSVQMPVFAVQPRTSLKKSASRSLRESGFLLGVIYQSYGGERGCVSSPIYLNAKEFIHERSVRQLEGRIVKLLVPERGEVNATVREIQVDPVTDVPVHVDFQSLDGKTSVKISVEVHIINADKCIGLKQGGVLNIIAHQIPFICNFDFIPTRIEVDVGGLNIGDSVHMHDIPLRGDIRPYDPTNFPIVSIGGSAEQTAESGG